MLAVNEWLWYTIWGYHWIPYRGLNQHWWLHDIFWTYNLANFNEFFWILLNWSESFSRSFFSERHLCELFQSSRTCLNLSELFKIFLISNLSESNWIFQTDDEIITSCPRSHISRGPILPRRTLTLKMRRSWAMTNKIVFENNLMIPFS